MSDNDFDQAPPYNFIGTVTTLPGRVQRKRRNPIGFIWPKAAKRRVSKKRSEK